MEVLDILKEMKSNIVSALARPSQVFFIFYEQIPV